MKGKYLRHEGGWRVCRWRWCNDIKRKRKKKKKIKIEWKPQKERRKKKLCLTYDQRNGKEKLYISVHCL